MHGGSGNSLANTCLPFHFLNRNLPALAFQQLSSILAQSLLNVPRPRHNLKELCRNGRKICDGDIPISVRVGRVCHYCLPVGVREISRCFQDVGMQLCRWNSSSPAVEAALRDLGLEVSSSFSPSSDLLKVLGLKWDKLEDCFTFSANELLQYADSLCPRSVHLFKWPPDCLTPLGFSIRTPSGPESCSRNVG